MFICGLFLLHMNSLIKQKQTKNELNKKNMNKPNKHPFFINKLK